jgi:hypothetical protein
MSGWILPCAGQLVRSVLRLYKPILSLVKGLCGMSGRLAVLLEAEAFKRLNNFFNCATELRF